MEAAAPFWAVVVVVVVQVLVGGVAYLPTDEREKTATGGAGGQAKRGVLPGKKNLSTVVLSVFGRDRANSARGSSAPRTTTATCYCDRSFALGLGLVVCGVINMAVLLVFAPQISRVGKTLSGLVYWQIEVARKVCNPADTRSKEQGLSELNAPTSNLRFQ